MAGVFLPNILFPPIYLMDQSLYRYSLYIALPLMLFFGFHMLLARTPAKQIYANFLLSRRLMGTALLILAANYSVHLFFAIRLRDQNATILMNLVTYFLCYWLFSSAMMTLLDRRYITRRRNHGKTKSATLQKRNVIFGCKNEMRQKTEKATRKSGFYHVQTAFEQHSKEQYI